MQLNNSKRRYWGWSSAILASLMVGAMLSCNHNVQAATVAAPVNETTVNHSNNNQKTAEAVSDSSQKSQTKVDATATNENVQSNKTAASMQSSTNVSTSTTASGNDKATTQVQSDPNVTNSGITATNNTTALNDDSEKNNVNTSNSKSKMDTVDQQNLKTTSDSEFQAAKATSAQVYQNTGKAQAITRVAGMSSQKMVGLQKMVPSIIIKMGKRPMAILELIRDGIFLKTAYAKVMSKNGLEHITILITIRFCE